MPDDPHDQMVVLLRRAIEGMDPIIPKDKVPLPDEDRNTQLYVLGLMTSTNTLMRTFFRAVEHKEGTSADVLGRSIVFGSVTLMYLGTHRDRLEEMVTQLQWNSTRKLDPVYESVLHADGSSEKDRQGARELLARNGRRRKRLEEKAKENGWSIDPLTEPEMAVEVQAEKLVTAMKHFDQAVHLNMTTVNSSVAFQPEQKNFTPTVWSSPLMLALAVDHVLAAFYGGLLAASDLMSMGNEVKREIARLRAEVFASWQPIFGGIAAGFTRERAEEEE